MGLLEQHTALYTPLDIEYAREMSGPYDDLRRLIVFPRTTGPSQWQMEQDHDLGVTIAGFREDRISGFWRPVVCFGPPEYQIEEVQRLWEISPVIAYEDYLVCGELSPVSRFLLEKGYTATPVYSQVIDMRAPFDTLRAGLRKSYRSLVNKQDHIHACTVAEVRAIHDRVRGVTRSEASWQIQEKMQTVCVADGDRAAVMFYAGPVWAYYACAAGEDGHAAVWTALNLLHERGVEFVEMGEQVFAGPDAKAVNIATYKRGFGGATKTRLLLTRGHHDSHC